MATAALSACSETPPEAVTRPEASPPATETSPPATEASPPTAEASPPATGDAAPLPPRRPIVQTEPAPHGARRVAGARLAAAPAVPPAVLAHAAPVYDIAATAAASCTSSDLVGLHGDALTNYLRGASDACLSYLWSWDANLQAALGDDANVTAVAGAIAALSPGYDGSDAAGLRQLIFFTRIAYYWSFYQSFTLSPQTTQAVKAAFDAFAANPAFNATNQAAASTLYEWINAVDAAVLGPHFVPQLESILNDFRGERQADYYQQINAYSVEYLVARETYYPAFQAAVDADLVAALEGVAREQHLFNPNTKYLVNNAVFAVGQVLSRVPARHDDAVGALTRVMNAYPQLSEPYLWGVKQLSLYNACHTADPAVTLCLSALVPEVLDAIVPNAYSFDDGAVQMRAAFDAPVARTYYHATRDVQAQYSRLAHDLLPAAGDPNGALDALVYGSRADFEAYQPLLFDLDPGNGGIYIEQSGIFYSYERTPAESIYTLEELFRHEYVHYLVGRYAVPGMWGETPLYGGNRMVWFDEGLAEFLTWSSPTAVHPRRTLVSQIQGDGGARLTPAQLFQSTYGDFKFYRYGGLFFNYLHQHDRGKILALLRAAGAGDAAAFDQIVGGLGADPALDAKYQAFLDAKIAQLGGLTNPSTIVPPPDALTNDVAAVQAAFRGAVGGDPQCSVASLALDGRFVCRGEITGAVMSADDAAAGAAFDRTMTRYVTTLRSNPLANLRHVTCRFGAVHFVPSGKQVYPTTTYYCDGPLGAGAPPYAPPPQMAQDDFRATRLGANAVCTADGPAQAECGTAITTALYSNATGNDVVVAELARSMNQLWEQVYGARPPFYRDLSCAFAGAPTVLPFGPTQKYGSVQVSCTVP